MPELLDRRYRDLESVLEALPNELKYWEGLSADRQPYEKHHTQVGALSRQMLALNERVRTSWNKSTSFAAIQKAQAECASLQGTWSYFRDRFVLRADARFGNYLRAADAYVWACYEPVLADRRKQDPTQPYREPPLVVCDVEQSPWARSRGKAPAPEGPTEPPEGSPLEQALASMPIAILAVPWSSVERLPNLVMLAHETGHVVESDFGLAETVGEKLGKATQASTLTDGWSHFWRKEVFADLFACFAGGPAFARALADVIPESPETVSTKVRPSGSTWGKYPPASLRMFLNVTALRHLGFAKEADAIWTYWTADYTAHAMSAFEDDAKVVVPAFYDAAKLPASLAYGEQVKDETQIYRATVELRNVLKPTERHDPRAVVGVACRVDRTPVAGVDREALWTSLQRYIVSSRPPGRLGVNDGGAAAPAEPWLQTDQLAAVLFAERADED